MNVSSIANIATSMAANRTEQAINITVLKKALDNQAATASALLDALPPVPVGKLPSNLGNNINTKA